MLHSFISWRLRKLHTQGRLDMRKKDLSSFEEMLSISRIVDVTRRAGVDIYDFASCDLDL